MTRRPDRRGFLRSVAGAAGAVVLGGCLEDVDRGSAGEVGGTVVDSAAPAEAWLVSRPLVRPRGIAAVWLASPPDRRPVAYVSMERRQVFVDRAHRDRSSWLLDAHISVSTGLWRIPLPGDSPLTPIPPGDEEREFEELAMGAWDPAMVPADGDVRILLGSRVAWVVPAACLPIQDSTAWLATERLAAERCRPGRGAAVREDFITLGRGRRHPDLACADGGVEVDVLGWACPV